MARKAKRSKRKSAKKSASRGGGGRSAQRAKFGKAAKVCWEEIASGKHANAARPAKMFGKCMKAELR
jgi:hypothetical protein